MTNTQNPIHLRAVDLEDLSVLSSLAQDALVPVSDMVYIAADNQFILALNRFHWERADAAASYTRGHAGLRFDHVTAVQRRGLERVDPNRILSLLAISYDGHAEGGTVMLTFSEDVAIRLSVSDLAVSLDDLGEPWPTQWKPGHTPD